MNKRQLVAAAARKTPLTRRQMAEALDALLETIAEVLESGDYVALSDFGHFSTQEYVGRSLSRFGKQGHYAVESRLIPIFKSSQVLRQRLRRRE
jgi:DNA-binding protein HU-beta